MAYEYLDINGVKVPLPLSAFPVGSVFISVNEASPASFIGGTWERIEDKFLLAAGSSYSAGSEGGTPNLAIVNHTHTVTIGSNKISRKKLSGGTGGGFYVPSQVNSDTGSDYWKSGLDMSDNYIYSTDLPNNGESGVGKNMPPYLSVYVWKRVA